MTEEIVIHQLVETGILIDLMDHYNLLLASCSVVTEQYDLYGDELGTISIDYFYDKWLGTRTPLVKLDSIYNLKLVK